jgi:hypothetical protein
MQKVASSFRDRSGYVVEHEHQFYRTVHASYQSHYDHLMSSGLYQELVTKHDLIAHEEVPELATSWQTYKVLKPEQLHFISYAAEWSFTMLQEAALCTLRIALAALKKKMMLKDANTYNIQFVNGKPLLIDTLSFEIYQEGKPWIAYRQFCECFLAPLVLMAKSHTALHTLFNSFPNGIPLDICKALLPFSTRFNVHIYLHIWLQANYQQQAGSKQTKTSSFSQQKLTTLLQGLHDFIKGLQPHTQKTVWDNYYAETILGDGYLHEKKQAVQSLVADVPFKYVIDLGANEGEFSMLVNDNAQQVISIDIDQNCIDRLYKKCKQDSVGNIHPLVINLTTPTPATGWQHTERPALLTRLKADLTLSLALIHHLAIANNIPLEKFLDMLAGIGPYHVVEFVAKEDPKVQELLAHREDIFDDYTLHDFRNYASTQFDILREIPLQSTPRTLFLLKRK